MSAADEVTSHIRGSLLDLRRRLDADVAIEVTRAVMLGAAQALRELTDGRPTAEPSGLEEPMDPTLMNSSKH